MKELLNVLEEKKYNLSDKTVVDWNDIEDAVRNYMLDLEIDVIRLELNKVIDSINKIEIKNGDFLLVKAKQQLHSNDYYHLFAEKLRYMLDKNDLADVTVILIGADTDIELLDEKMMYKVGWLKKNKIFEIFKNLRIDDKNIIEE